MSKYIVDIEKIQEYHRNGQLKKARIGYLKILRKEPKNAKILHALGILCTQEEKFVEAGQYLDQAHRYDPQNLPLILHYANVLKFQGLFNKAAELLQNLLQNHPSYTAAYNNLGTIYYAQGQLDAAIVQYQKAVALQDNYLDAYYNLGLALSKNNQIEAAIDTFQKILQMASNHVPARYHLASIFMQQQKTSAAIEEFLRIESEHPHHFETQCNLGHCLLTQGKLTEAKKHYQQALELKPGDSQILFNMGVIHMEQGLVDQAIQFYQRVLQVSPDLFAAHHNIAIAYLAKQHVGYALHHFKEGLRLQPNNAALQYTVTSLSENQRLLQAPTEYIQSLFDAYADHYDVHLLGALEYQMPKLFLEKLRHFVSQEKKYQILDLGCGTGLCGEICHGFAKKIIGIDVSEKMLAMARSKNIYDDVIIADMTTYLTLNSTTFDIILAGDVLVYTGALEALFESLSQALIPGGLFIFNTEITESKDFKMNQSGRFSHNKSYIDNLAAKNQLKILSYDVCTTRFQNNMPVPGHLYVLKRAL